MASFLQCFKQGSRNRIRHRRPTAQQPLLGPQPELCLGSDTQDPPQTRVLEASGSRRVTTKCSLGRWGVPGGRKPNLAESVTDWQSISNRSVDPTGSPRMKMGPPSSTAIQQGSMPLHKQSLSVVDLGKEPDYVSQPRAAVSGFQLSCSGLSKYD